MHYVLIIILICLFLIVYGFLFYPISLFIFSKLFKNRILPETNYNPDITIIISAYNEEKLITDAVNSIYDNDYPAGKIFVLAASDGSTDNTYNLLKELSSKYPNLQSFNFDRIGKNAVLNNLIEKIETEVTFFMDADIQLQKGVIYKLLSYLGNAEVGAVLSSMKSIGDGTDSAGGYGEVLYQKIERTFRIMESRISSTVNALGAFYGLKSELIEALPNDIVADDYYPLLVAMEKKKRVVFIDEAEVLEVRGKSTSDEFNRRIRASASAMSALMLKMRILNPLYGWVSYFLFCHRILRWLTPVFMMIMLVLTFFLENNTMSYLIVSLQLNIYFGALIGYILEKKGKNIVLFKIPLYIVTMSIGFLGAFYRFFSGKNNSQWQR